MGQTIIEAMRDDSIEEVANSLQHIWDAKDITVYDGMSEEEEYDEEVDWADLSFEGGLTRGAQLTITETVELIITMGDFGADMSNTFELHCGDVNFTCKLSPPYTEASCEYEVKPSSESSASPENQRALIDKWLPFFRRNCYLSGCPIECSDREKLEWNLWLKEKELVLKS